MIVTVPRLLRALGDAQETDLNVLFPDETLYHIREAAVNPHLRALPPHHQCDAVREELCSAVVAGIMVGLALTLDGPP